MVGGPIIENRDYWRASRWPVLGDWAADRDRNGPRVAGLSKLNEGSDGLAVEFRVMQLLQ